MNIPRTVLLLLLTFVSIVAFGQTSKKYEKYLTKYNYDLGYIETRGGHRIEGLIKSPSGLKAYSKVVFVSKQGTKSTYYPSGLKAYGTDYEQYESNRSSFLKVVTKSNGIGLYKMATNTSWSAPGPYGSAPMIYNASSTNYYTKRSSEVDYVRVRKKKFQATFYSYFSDCPSLQSKIGSEEFTHKNPEKMVKFYQFSCRQQEAMKIESDRF